MCYNKFENYIVHGPITEDDMLEIGEEVVLYAAA